MKTRYELHVETQNGRYCGCYWHGRRWQTLARKAREVRKEKPNEVIFATYKRGKEAGFVEV